MDHAPAQSASAPTYRLLLSRLLVDAQARFHSGSRSLVTFCDGRAREMVGYWLLAICGIGGIKIATAPVAVYGASDAFGALVPFLLVAVAPLTGYAIAAGSFPRGTLPAQPATRLCRYGRWQALDIDAVTRNPAFGPLGFMASLIFGILLNVPFRSAEFLIAVPAVATGAPPWAHTIMQAMVTDVVIMNFFYMVCFVMALRSIPLFPRMLLFAWLADIALQLTIARMAAADPGIPLSVARGLVVLLHGNVEKVLISAAVWLPYLILSDRVNVTFRHRVRN